VLAVESGLSWSAIAQIESGRRRDPRPSTLARLARALGVSIDYLVDGAAAPPATLSHRALVYEDDDAFVAAAGAFLAEGAERSEALLAVTTRAGGARLRRHLGRAGSRVEFVDTARWHATPLRALEAHRAFLDRSLRAGACWARVVVEPVFDGGGPRAAARLSARYEALLDVALASAPAAFLCAYDRRALPPAVVRQALLTHRETGGGDYRDPGAVLLEG
jgi:transcriptional regulator with XRE-family HTH domain